MNENYLQKDDMIDERVLEKDELFFSNCVHLKCLWLEWKVMGQWVWWWFLGPKKWSIGSMDDSWLCLFTVVFGLQ